MKPDPRWVAEFYSRAAAGDSDAHLQLIRAYQEHINEVGREFAKQYNRELEAIEISVAGWFAIGASLKKIEFSSDCQSYAAWVEKNIRYFIERRFLKATGKIQ